MSKVGLTGPIKVVTSSALTPQEHEQLAAVARATQDKMLAKTLNLEEEGEDLMLGAGMHSMVNPLVHPHDV